jgi:hypothetical protein
MNRFLMPGVLAAVLCASAASAETRIQVNIGSAPPPPMVVFQAPPPQVWVPDARVYIVGATSFPYDCFHVGAYFYIYNDGWWYRAPRYNGPYAVIESRYVPAAVWRVPPARWRHHPHGMPPGQAKKYSSWWNGAGPGEQGHGHGHGHDER